MASKAVSEVSICNMAISNCGGSPIESITENSTEAKQCNTWFTFARRQALEAYDWSFARRRLTLATHSDAEPDGVWSYRYQYPSDCVMFRKIQNPEGDIADPVPFEIETDDAQITKSILTDLDDAIGVYTFDLTDTTLFPSHFIITFSYALAARISFAITGKVELSEIMDKKFNDSILLASASNANEQMRPPPRDADWIRNR